MTGWLHEVLPILRDPDWPGWAEVFVRDAPTFVPSGWAPRLGYMVRAPFGSRLLSAAEVLATGLATVHGAALGNLSRIPGDWTVRAATGGFLGLGKKAQCLEHTGDFAAERLLLGPFLEKAISTLEKSTPDSHGIGFLAPVRGLLWAVPATLRTGPGQSATNPLAAQLAAEGEHLRQNPAGREALCGGTLLSSTPVVFEGGRAMAVSFRGASARPYVPLLSALLPRIDNTHEKLRIASFFQDKSALPPRPLTGGPFGLGLQVAVSSPGGLWPLPPESVQALGKPLAELEALAWRNLGPAGPVRMFAPGIAGYREPNGGVRIADREAMLRLHQALQCSRLVVTLVHPRMMAATPFPLRIPQSDYLVRIMDYFEDPPPPGQPRGYLSTGGTTWSPVVHIVDDGQLVHSPEPT